MTRIERAFGILLLLSDGRTVTATELARRFEVSIRTIYRDVEMLSQTGVPVYAERGSQGGYRLLEGYFLPPIAFSRDEIVAVLLGLALSRGLKVTPFAAALDAAERKLVAVLPSRLRPLLGETQRLIGFERSASDAFHSELPQPSDSPPAEDARAVEIFLKAVLEGTRVRFAYRSPYRDRGVAEAIEAEPQGLLWDRDLWYLIGRKLDIGRKPRQRFWRADRIAGIEASTLRAHDTTAGAAPAFDVRRHLGRAWLAEAMTQWSRTSPVRIRLTPAQAKRLRGDWYFRFAEFTADGAGAVVMTYGENDRAAVFELVRWLGPGAELLEPEIWREALGQELRAMAARYGS
jgi:predicted DNA-binding transcriptional regulator YafY